MSGKHRQLVTWLRADWDRGLGLTLIAVGVVALLIGYQGAADAAFVVEALSYIASGGLGGVLLVAGGLTLLLSADLHDEWRKLDRIEEAIRGLGTDREVVLPPVASAREDRPPDENGSDENGSGEADGVAASRRWRRRSVSAFGLLALVCGGALALAWDGTASAAEPGDAFEAAAGASSAVVLYGIAAGALLLVQRYRNTLRRQRILAPFGALMASASRAFEAPDPGGDGHVHVAPGLGRYHRAGCPALVGVASRAVDVGAVPDGLRPCGLCHSR